MTSTGEDTNLCSVCRIAFESMHNPTTTATFSQLVIDTGDTTKIKPEESAATCFFCHAILSRIKNPFTLHNGGEFGLTYWGVGNKSKEKPIINTYSTSFEDGTGFYATASVWAEQGSTAATERIAVQPPILGNDAKAISDWIRIQLEVCKDLHPRCPRDDNVVLPTRVLRITGGGDMPTVQLVETNGINGRYCALSHCWGHEEKRPLTTTLENFRRHTSAIPFEHLPRTFREAVLLVRSLEISFLWIDSLCIIQDSELDWRIESQKMGPLYRNAALVIAAADSKDSTEGLFIANRSPNMIMTIPYLSCNGEFKGFFNMLLREESEKFPFDSHLSTRAWAFQESYLARRIVFFMSSDVSMMCRGGPLIPESGEILDYASLQPSSWFEILGQYSKLQLTKHGDRLFALQGIVDELKSHRKDTYLSEYGVWEADLVEQLLWRRSDGVCVTDLPLIPSWSWAATSGHKVWPCWPWDAISRYKESKPWIKELFPEDRIWQLTVCPPNAMNLTRILGSGRIMSTGHVLSIKYWKKRIPRCFINWLYSYAQGFGVWEFMPTPSDNYISTYLVMNKTKDTIFGVAIFDRDFIDDAVCFLIHRSENLDKDAGSLSEDVNHELSKERPIIPASDIDDPLDECGEEFENDSADEILDHLVEERDYTHHPLVCT
ncbi:heterokaryon incompatibility protein-domain-containing protein [Dendryphion nanum]|uniref:Heterokaryon incompatibility protein-domain-containing protein n=1 Tax=Dendryphion nanum TaxID=256645 RepID=A0A9P9DB59_9PLEO|nr:heterokaryon incompatibility protein-domain-containing protein [Dendryphion nanum]